MAFSFLHYIVVHHKMPVLDSSSLLLDDQCLVDHLVILLLFVFYVKLTSRTV